MGFESLGVHECCYKSIKGEEIDLRKEFASNVILTGGTTLMKGFPERFKKELTNLSLNDSKNLEFNVSTHPEKLNSAWLGAAIVSTFWIFGSLWICKEEYDESGPSI